MFKQRQGKMKLILATFVMSFLVFGFQNCGQAGFQASNKSADIASMGNPVETTMVAKRECEFIGTDVMGDRLKSVLGIASGDVPRLDPANGNAINGPGRLAAASGALSGYSCGVSKYKGSFEVMIDACTQAVSNVDVKNSLFPNGPENFDALYMKLVGREPTRGEAEMLLELVRSSKIPSAKREAAACAAVATTVESLIKI
jgi:hypothetical protein